MWLFPADKAPELEDIMAKVYRACWDFMKEDMDTMMQAFWLTGVLAAGVISVPTECDCLDCFCKPRTKGISFALLHGVTIHHAIMVDLSGNW